MARWLAAALERRDQRLVEAAAREACVCSLDARLRKDGHEGRCRSLRVLEILRPDLRRPERTHGA